MKEVIRKLTSRKLWMAIAGVVTGIAVSLGAGESDIQAVAGAVATLISAITYIITEGKVDAERVKNAIEETQYAVEVIENVDEK